MRLLSLLRAGLLVALLSLPLPARASDPAADALFDAGKALMEEGKLDEACAKFEASYKLDPALGALLNLANCLEQSGRIASAWTRWGEASDAAARANDDRKAFADERRSALRPRLPTLELRVTGDADGLTIWRDDVEIAVAAAGVPLPIDPGAHHIEVTRGEDVLHAADLTAKEAEPIVITLDFGEIRGRAPIGRRGGGAKAQGGPVAPPRAPAAEPYTFWTEPRIAGAVLGSVGLATSVVGFLFGGLALAEKNEADAVQNCTSKRSCAPQGIDAINQAETFAHVSTGLLAGGGVLAAVGLVLLVVPSGEGPQTELDKRASRGLEIKVGAARGADLGLGVVGTW